MDLRALFAVGLLTTALLAPGATAAPCTGDPGVHCEATVGRCDLDAGADVVTTTAAGASADCRGGSMTRCFVGVGVGQDLLDPTVDQWCAF